MSKLEFVKQGVRRSTIILLVLFGILAGLGAALFGTGINTTLGIVTLGLTPLLLLGRRWAVFLALAVGMVVGLHRGQAIYNQLQGYHLFEGEKIELAGTVLDDPSYHDSGQLEFFVGDVLIGGLKLPGRVLVRGFVGNDSFRRGDKVRAIGRLNPGFGNRQGSMSYAEITLLRPNNSWLEDLRRRFFAGVYTALPEPQGSLGLGFLVGTRNLLPDNLGLELRRVGLTHIVAVSGYNLTILVRFARRAGMKFSKRLAALLATALVGGFILIAGTSPSISRAAAVTGLALTAWYYGRKASPLMLLLFSSALTAMINPLFLWADLGWWLSFLAFFGILIVAPLAKARLFGQRKIRTVPQIMLETASAQLMTLPLIMVIFGEFSVVALLANLIVLPLVPIAMLSAFVSGLAGMIMPASAAWFAWPARVVLTFVTEVVSLLSKPDWALLERYLSVFSAGLIYCLVLALCLVLYRALRRQGQPVFIESVIE